MTIATFALTFFAGTFAYLVARVIADFVKARFRGPVGEIVGVWTFVALMLCAFGIGLAMGVLS